MTIQVGDKIPSATLKQMTPEGPKDITTDELFRGKKVALFAVPGAFTPACSQRHLPGYVDKAADIKAKGVDEIVCVAVNDVFVMTAWGKEQRAEGKVRMLADGSGDFVRALGLELDLSKMGLGTRSKRYSMLVDNGVVKSLNVEQQPGQVEGFRRRGDAAGALGPARRSLYPRVSAEGCFPQLSSAMRARAIASARSFSGWPEWPRTHSQVDDVPGRRGIEPLPKIDILDRLLVGGQPVPPLPAVYPFGDAVAQILAVAVEPDAARPLQRFEPGDRRHHLHAVVGRLGVIAAQFLFDLAIAQYRGPAARARVAAASPVGEDLDIGQLRHRARSPRYR